MTIAIAIHSNGVSPLAALGGGDSSASPAPGFLDLVNQALQGVSGAQAQASTAEAGYTIGDRVLRPALVGVSKGGPKSAKAE